MSRNVTKEEKREPVRLCFGLEARELGIYWYSGLSMKVSRVVLVWAKSC